MRATLCGRWSECLYSGAFRAGKTVALLISLIMRADRPFAREGLCRYECKTLKDTTLRSLLQGSGAKVPPLLTPGTYTHHKQEQTITLHATGGQIVYFGLDDLTKLGSKELTGCAVDEAAELDEDRWLWVQGRCSLQVAGIAPVVYGACNPDVPSHFLAARFGLALDAVRQRQCFAVRTKTADNPHNSPEYLEIVNRFTGTMRRRYVLGEWCASDHMVYPQWDRDVHVRRRVAGWKRAYIAIDDGRTNPFAAILFLEDADGRLHALAEVHGSNMEESAKIEALRLLSTRSPIPIEAVIIDPSAPAKTGLRNHASVPVLDGDNDVNTGIAEVSRRLDKDPSGEPLLTFSPDCRRTIAEMESYERKPDTEEPIKKNDHGPDATRYMAMHMRTPAATVFDSTRMVELRTKAEEREKPRCYAIVHEVKAGVPQDRSLMEGEANRVFLQQRADGPLRVWGELWNMRPPTDRTYAVFVSVGDGATCPSVIAVCDSLRGEVVAEWKKAGVTPERVARVAAMLSLFFTGRMRDEEAAAMVGHTSWGPGAVCGSHLTRICRSLWKPKDQTEPGWNPTPEQFSESIGLLRAAWELGALHEPEPETMREASHYVWHGKQVLPLWMMDRPEARATLADRVIARCGLWMMLRGIETPEVLTPKPPFGSLGYLIEQSMAEQEDSGSMHLG